MRLDRPRAQMLTRRLDSVGRQPVGFEFEHEEPVEQPALRSLADESTATPRDVDREFEGEGVAEFVEVAVAARRDSRDASPRNAIERSRLMSCLFLNCESAAISRRPVSHSTTARMTDDGVSKAAADDLGDVRRSRRAPRPNRYSLTRVMNVSRSAVNASALSSTRGRQDLRIAIGKVPQYPLRAAGAVLQALLEQRAHAVVLVEMQHAVDAEASRHRADRRLGG